MIDTRVDRLVLCSARVRVCRLFKGEDELKSVSLRRGAILPLVACAALSLAGTAQADMPVFSADCPMGLRVTSDAGGNVRVNGAPASVRMYNPDYFEATAGGIDFTISTEEDGSGLIVGYVPPGSAGGYCTIVSGESAPAPETLTGEPDHFEVNVDSRLIVHSRPSTSSPMVSKLPGGAVVENLGCMQAEGREWCHVSDGRVSGWAAAEFLVASDGPVRAARATPVAEEGDPDHTVERVTFPSGSSGTEFTDSLNPGDSRHYVVGARSGQFFSFKITANGPGLTYVIYNPDGSVLLDEISASEEYRGQLWQSGDHVVAIYNATNGSQSYELVFGID
ncbi:SH3 domain-containing protein [Lutimaribacter marinistellae]|uniref:SH3 domain-containing protein n=1 Tax=Lutimaribacter marinistellae TaxID=1820329 RepID=A0ABV7TJH5_9RHOB